MVTRKYSAYPTAPIHSLLLSDSLSCDAVCESNDRGHIYHCHFNDPT